MTSCQNELFEERCSKCKGTQKVPTLVEDPQHGHALRVYKNCEACGGSGLASDEKNNMMLPSANPSLAELLKKDSEEISNRFKQLREEEEEIPGFMKSGKGQFIGPQYYKENAIEEKQIVDKTNPLDIQVGGGHYKTCKIQPEEYIVANELGYCEGAIVKYITRYKDKGGIEDLNKIKHFVDLIIELRYNNEE